MITVNQAVYWSVYGPTVKRPHGTYSIRYAGYGRVDIFQQLYRMNKASNFKEWQTAVKEGGLPCFNIGYADKDGNIYYLYNGMIPLRNETSTGRFTCPATPRIRCGRNTCPSRSCPRYSTCPPALSRTPTARLSSPPAGGNP